MLRYPVIEKWDAWHYVDQGTTTTTYSWPQTEEVMEVVVMILLRE